MRRSAARRPRSEGSADLNVNVQVEPSDGFISRIETVLRNSINAFGAGAVAPGSSVGTAGSTGLSMPEAVPPRWRSATASGTNRRQRLVDGGEERQQFAHFLVEK